MHYLQDTKGQKLIMHNENEVSKHVIFKAGNNELVLKLPHRSQHRRHTPDQKHCSHLHQSEPLQSLVMSA